MGNPFKFGSVAEGNYFTDRINETREIATFLDSNNHLVLISPRRYGKTSLIKKVLSTLDRPAVYLDLQLVTGVADMATQLMKRFLKVNAWERMKHLMANFRIIPTIEINPLTNEAGVSFSPSAADNFATLEDVLDLIEKSGDSGKRPIVVFDEFQEIDSLGKTLSKQLRSIMQHHANINYILMGSAESMMRRMFEIKKSPFYHFAALMTLEKIPYEDFWKYLEERLSEVTKKSAEVAGEVLEFTECHPYYTQQLGFYCYAFLERNNYRENLITTISGQIVELHDNDYERLWGTLNKTDRQLLITLATGRSVSQAGIPTSTAYSALKRLAVQGFLIKEESYGFDDPFFKLWIRSSRA
ncbi:MAG TPA: ATP-binding protein [Coriobacteriia bacterium]|nr:ATP-binding protein [Coriobacteriia bacterium]